MAVILALLAAASWGSSDYAGGVASRKNSAMAVVALTHLVAVAALLYMIVDPSALAGLGLRLAVAAGSGADAATVEAALSLPPLGAALPFADLGWGVAAGLSGGLGVLLLFRGLARGAMSVVAPVTAAGAACVPALYGLARGDALSPLQVGGIGAALVAIVVISAGSPGDAGADTVPPEPVRLARRGRSGADASAGAAVAVCPCGRPVAPAESVPSRFDPRRWLSQPGIPEALLSGVGFGSFFVFLHHTRVEAGLWPLVTARSTSALIFLAVALAARSQVLPSRGSRWPVAAAGALDGAAAVLFMVATRHGSLAVVSVLASLYPAMTVVLARIHGREPCSRRQLAGMGLAGVSVAVLAAG